ncbi:hypothetical protein [Novosphingobium sp. JCM 18896]|uniref:hypothetical protein n=1 Tax=Novosphingobium sp. JCM 18896 TaxID=2989731 RepID=UPI00222379A9|nr:hypothetical protein [Novosphingobium sp. JCM 18896]MCW1428035.1 hypothetical protein [Novosphingobium sp. JCM 18896]
MIDKSRDPAHTAADQTAAGKAKRLALLSDFAPVPRHYDRHDGWTPERQRGFIAALADTGSVKAAAHAVNMAPEGAYHLRRHPQAHEFRKAWEVALALGVQRLEDVAMDRALNGVEVPVYSYGKLVGTRRKYNDRLLMFLLRTRAKKRFGEDGRMNLADRATLANLKRQWRKQWDQERALAEAERTRQSYASIHEKLTDWDQRRTREIARALRTEWLRLGGPPALPDDEDLDEDEEAEFEDEDVEESAGCDAETPREPSEADGIRTVSLKHGWPDDGRATPFRGR